MMAIPDIKILNWEVFFGGWRVRGPRVTHLAWSVQHIRLHEIETTDLTLMWIKNYELDRLQISWKHSQVGNIQIQTWTSPHLQQQVVTLHSRLLMSMPIIRSHTISYKWLIVAVTSAARVIRVLNSYLVYLLSDWIWNQSNYSKFLNTYLNVIYRRKGLRLSKKMWLSAALLLTMVLTLDSSWRLYTGPLWHTKYWKNTTACPRHKTQTGCHKNCWTYLTSTYINGDFKNGENYSTLFENFEYWPNIWFDSKWKKHYSHSTSCDQIPPQFTEKTVFLLTFHLVVEVAAVSWNFCTT